MHGPASSLVLPCVLQFHLLWDFRSGAVPLVDAEVRSGVVAVDLYNLVGFR